jgi:dCTP diphosphatase
VTDAPSSLTELRDEIREFAAERDWQQFHSPKNLVMALAGEVGELLELFQWLTPEESLTLRGTDRIAAVADELADVQYYLIRLADVLDVDLMAAAKTKLQKNRDRYPVAKSRGSARKYTELE